MTRAPAAQIGALALLAAISPLATGMYLPAFTRIATDLGCSASAVQLTITGFLVGLALGQLVIGALSDRTGRRAPLVVCGVACVIASAACAVAPDIAVLVAARCAQGFAGAAGVVLGRAMIADRGDRAAAARTFSVLATIGALAPVLAPLAGDALLGFGGWRTVFVALAVIALVMVVGAILLLPETLPRERRHRGGIGQVLREARSVLANRGYVSNALVFAASYATLTAYVSASPFVLQVLFGFSPTGYALVFAANAGGLTLGSLLNTRLVGRYGPRRLLRIGLAIQFGAVVLLLALALAGALTVVALLILLWSSVASLGFIAGNATSLALGHLGAGLGTASAVLGAGQFGLAAAVAPLVGLGGSGTAVPMAIVMAVTAAAAAGAVVSGRAGPESAGSGEFLDAHRGADRGAGGEPELQ